MIPIKVSCPKCGKNEFWTTRDSRFKCKSCRFLFTPRENPFNIPNGKLKKVIEEFLKETPSNRILEKVRISKYKLLKILTVLRKKLAQETNTISGSEIKLKELNKERMAIGILIKEGKILAKILEIEPEELKMFFSQPIEKPEEWMKDFGIIYQDSLFRILQKEELKSDLIENFWQYIREKVFSRRGIRKEKLPLYLGEYVWRFNNRHLGFQEKEKTLLELIAKIKYNKS